MRRFTEVVAAATLALATSLSARPANAQSSASASGQIEPVQLPAWPAPRDTPRSPSPAPAGRRWSLSSSAASVFESNIDRNQQNNQAEGLVVGLGGEFRNRINRPSFVAQYRVGGHMYAGAPRWDRISHNARAAYNRPLIGPLAFEGVSEVSIKGSTEDRELGNQFIVSPRLQYRFWKTLRLDLETGYRVKRYADTERNATNPYAGLRLTQRFGRGRWDLGYRYEENHSEGARNRYIRSTYSSDLVVPAARRDSIGLELKFRTRRYGRLVSIGDTRVPLRDGKWSVSPEWIHFLTPGLQLRASYEFEARDANDPGRDYGAHSTILTIERRW